MIGDILSAGLGLIGQNKQNKAITEGNRIHADAIKEINDQQIKFATDASKTDWLRRLDFDKNKIQRLVLDAKAAGINPLAALGVSTAGTPVTQVPTLSAPDVQIPNKSRSYDIMGQAIGRAFDNAAKEQPIPPGAVVKPLGTKWPHYTDPKTGKAKPYSAAQAESYMALERHDMQMGVMNAEIQHLQSLANPAPKEKEMFTVWQTPIGNVPFPVQEFGEISEAMDNSAVRYMWWDNIVTNHPATAKKIQDSVARGAGASLGTTIENTPSMADEAWQMFKHYLSGRKN